MITVKTASEIAIMTHACQILARCFESVQPYVVSGVTTAQLNTQIEDFLQSADSIPAFRGYNGFPAASCISVNDVIVHGIPSHTQVLQPGDIVSIDIGALYRGYYSDAARTFAVGRISGEHRRLIDVTERAFWVGIEQARTGQYIGDIGGAIADFVQAQGFGVVRALCGHGIGRKLHEEPSIPNFRTSSRGARIRDGFCLAIEPMVNLGDWEARMDRDGTWRTADGLASAHYENTIAIIDGKAEVLTI